MDLIIEMDFFTWIRKIEFDRLKKYYINNDSEKRKGNQKEVNLLKKYLESKITFVNYDDYEFNKLIKEFEKEYQIQKIRNQIKRESEEHKREKIENDNKEILKVDDIINFIKDYLSTLTDEKYNKMRKHKILYFMFAFAINLNNSVKLWKENSEIFKLFHSQFNKTDPAKWCAFENGPILKNIYSIKGDKKLFFSIEKTKLSIFEIAYFLLRNFSTLQLVEESHKTSPWKEYYNPASYYAEIPSEEMIEYFKKNKPFFAQELKY